MSIRWPMSLTPSYLSRIIRRQKNPITALQLFNSAQSRYPDYRHNGPVYADMIKILGNFGKIAEMKEIIRQMRHDSCECKDSVFVSAINTYAKAGLTHEAFSLFANIPEFNCIDWTESFNTVLRLMVSESRFDLARRIFLENSARSEVRCYLQSLNLFMSAICQKGRSDIALLVFQEMKHQLVYPDRESYKILMKGLCKDKRLNDAILLLYSMFRRISQKGSGADVVVYRTLFEALCDNGKLKEAVEILNKIFMKGIKISKQKRKLICVQLASQDPESIKSTINRVLVISGIPSLESYCAMAIDLYEEGRISEGDFLYKKMREKGFKPTGSMYEAKLIALCSRGEVKEAMKVIEVEMLEASYVPKVSQYNVVLKALCEQGESKDGARYLKRMTGCRGCMADGESYGVLVAGLCRDGEFEEAARVLEKMLKSCYWGCDETYNVLVEGLCFIGKPYEAVLWLEEMVSQGRLPRLSVWSSLVSSVCCDQSADFELLMNALSLD